MAEHAEWLDRALAKVALCLPLQKNWNSYGAETRQGVIDIFREHE